MRLSLLFFILSIPPLLANESGFSNETAMTINSLDWHIGPQIENVASKAILKTDSTLAFLDDVNSKKFLSLTGNLPESGNFIIVSTKHNWWGSFSFSPVGYVKDNEKIDPDVLFRQLKDSEPAENEERKRLGLSPLYIIGWFVPPHYDVESKRLEWGLKVRSEEGENLNYTIRLLGKTGVMSATLVSDLASFDADVKTFKAALRGFEFNTGERYAEFKQGDRVAEFGLAALITGGAAAVATKKGLWAVIASFFVGAGKLVVAGVIGFFALLGGLVKKWIGGLFKEKS